MRAAISKLASKFSIDAFSGLLLTFFTPIAPLMVVVGLAIMSDTFTGLYRSYKSGIELTSHKARNIISKMIVYQGAVILMYCIERFVVSDIVKIFIDVDLFLTKLVCCTLLVIELKSINENYKAVTGVDMWFKFKSMVIKVNELKKELKYEKSTNSNTDNDNNSTTDYTTV
ncbi:MAG: phage holin family protein [Gammaproteobacteria bacterium]|nr:phage holin family protein [Gammaproteobacteria bacterium]